MARSISGQLVLQGEVSPGLITFTERIETIERRTEAPDRFILPGFIDTHVHGGAGADTMDGPEAVLRLARFHAQHGTTTLLPTTITQNWPQVIQALQGVKAARERSRLVLGAHLEGPFISPGRLGAQPPLAILPMPELISELLDLNILRAITIAPELPGALEAAVALARAGVRIGVGHTRAEPQEVQALVTAVQAVGGRVAATHLFNAMGGIEARAPGPAGALLTSPGVFQEVILDGLHVHPLSFQLAGLAAPGRVMLVSDAMRAAGLADGESELGGQRVLVHQGRATLADGTLAGSLLTLDQALSNALHFGCALPQASVMLSGVPACSLGLTDRGRLEVGLRADLVVMNAEFRVEEVYVLGERMAV